RRDLLARRRDDLRRRRLYERNPRGQRKHDRQEETTTLTSDGAGAVGPRHLQRELTVDQRDELLRIHAGELVARALQLGTRIRMVPECSKGSGKCDSGFPEVREQSLLAEQPKGLVEVGDGIAPFALGRCDRGPSQTEGSLCIRIFRRQVSTGELHELTGFPDTALLNQCLGEIPIDLDHEPAPELQRERHGLAEPFLSEAEVTSREGVARELPEVLELEVSVSRTLEPLERSKSEPLGLVELPAVVPDETEEGQGSRFVAKASQFGGQFGALFPGLLGACKIGDVEAEAPNAHVPFDPQGPVVDVLGDGQSLP